MLVINSIRNEVLKEITCIFYDLGLLPPFNKALYIFHKRISPNGLKRSRELTLKTSVGKITAGKKAIVWQTETGREQSNLIFSNLCNNQGTSSTTGRQGHDSVVKVQTSSLFVKVRLPAEIPASSRSLYARKDQRGTNVACVSFT